MIYPRDGQSGAEPQPTVRLRTALHEFFVYARARFAQETQKQYVRNLRAFHQWSALRPKRQRVYNLADVTPDVLADYQRCLNTGMRPDGHPFTQPLKEARLYSLKAFLNFCHRKGFLSHDLRRFIIVPRREYKVPKPLLTAEEMTRLLEAPSEHTTVGIRDRAMLELAYSGLRSIELLNLTIEDIDLEENRVFLRETKGDKDRVVPMTQQAIYWVRRWLSRRTRYLNGAKSNVLFITKNGRPIGRRQFAVSLVRHAQRAQLPTPPSPHDLRRITTTHLAQNGAPMRLIQALLGHTSLKVTTKYLRLTDSQVKQEYGRTHPSTQRSRHLDADA